MSAPELRNHPFASLLALPTCRAVRLAVETGPCHLVGGALRDCFLGSSATDLDAIVSGQGRQVAQRLSSTLGGRLVELGGERFATYRVVLPEQTIDLWDRGELALDLDLRRRDFTIHSFALDLRTGEIVDPFGGVRDLAEHRLRATTDTSFVEDPLRILRLCRFLSLLPGFDVEAATLQLAARSAEALPAVAVERCRTELEMLFDSPLTDRVIELILDLRIVRRLWLAAGGRPAPTGPHTAKMAGGLPRVVDEAARLSATIDLYAAQVALVVSGVALDSGIPPLDAVAVLRRGGLITRSRAERVATLLRWTSLPREEGEQRWFLHCMGPLWPSALSLQLARAWVESDRASAARAARAIVALVDRCSEEIFRPPRLVSGDELQRLLGLSPGKRLGKILRVIRRHQIEGRIRNRDQAVHLARELAGRGAPGVENP